MVLVRPTVWIRCLNMWWSDPATPRPCKQVKRWQEMDGWSLTVIGRIFNISLRCYEFPPFFWSTMKMFQESQVLNNHQSGSVGKNVTKNSYYIKTLRSWGQRKYYFLFQGICQGRFCRAPSAASDICHQPGAFFSWRDRSLLALIQQHFAQI